MKTQANKIKLLVFTTVFGVLWGLLEMFIGSWLHILNVPFKGAAMAGIGAVILITGRCYTNQRFACINTAVVAMLVKFMSIGAVKIGPAAGILIEGAIMEIVFAFLPVNFLSVMLGSVLCCLEGIPHFFVTNTLIYGKDIFSVYMQALTKVQKYFGLPENAWLLVLFVWLAGHIVIGLIAGLTAYKTCKYLKKI